MRAFVAISVCTGPGTTEIYTLSLHDALPIFGWDGGLLRFQSSLARCRRAGGRRSEEHTSELQSLRHLVCRLLLEKKKHSWHSADATRGAASAVRPARRRRT